MKNINECKIFYLTEVLNNTEVTLKLALLFPNWFYCFPRFWSAIYHSNFKRYTAYHLLTFLCHTSQICLSIRDMNEFLSWFRNSDLNSLASICGVFEQQQPCWHDTKICYMSHRTWLFKWLYYVDWSKLCYPCCNCRRDDKSSYNRSLWCPRFTEVSMFKHFDKTFDKCVLAKVNRITMWSNCVSW